MKQSDAKKVKLQDVLWNREEHRENKKAVENVLEYCRKVLLEE